MPYVLLGDVLDPGPYHPVLGAWRDGDEVAGISPIDGSRPRSCSLANCGVLKLDLAAVGQAVERARRSQPDGGSEL